MPHGEKQSTNRYVLGFQVYVLCALRKDGVGAGVGGVRPRVVRWVFEQKSNTAWKTSGLV